MPVGPFTPLPGLGLLNFLTPSKPAPPAVTPAPAPYKARFPVSQNDWQAVSRLQPTLHKAAMQTGWPEDYLTAQAISESSGGQNVQKKANTAKGVFQQRDYPYIEKRFSGSNENPDSSAVHAGQMNQWLLGKTNGDTTAALTRYNHGPSSGKNTSKYALKIEDIVKQIRSQRAINDYNKNNGSGSKISPNTNGATAKK